MISLNCNILNAQDLLSSLRASTTSLEARKKLDELNFVGTFDRIASSGNIDNFVDEIKSMAQQQNSYALECLGLMYREGFQVPRDQQESINNLKKSATLGNVSAMMFLADFYQLDPYNSDQIRMAISWLYQATKLNSTIAMVRLGKLLYHHFKHEEDQMEQVKELYERAANLGNSDAMIHLGDFYASGHITLVKDNQTASDWYQKAANLGNLKASGRLSSLESY